MTYKEFVLEVSELVPVREKDYKVTYYSYKYGNTEITDKNINNLVIFEAREIGGVSGGSCWDSSNPQPYSANEKFEDELDKVLYRFKPDIGFLEYKRMSAIQILDTQTEYEYYGNRTEYEVRMTSLKQLYEMLFSGK